MKADKRSSYKEAHAFTETRILYLISNHQPSDQSTTCSNFRPYHEQCADSMCVDGRFYFVRLLLHLLTVCFGCETQTN